jgi:MoaA/NifB/PqqE/SkfB family radical SAM enzyme
MAINGVTSTWGKQTMISNANVNKAIKQWITGLISTKDMKNVMNSYPRKSHLSMAINNICNLKCKHCFLKYNSEKDLSTEQWLQILDSSLELNLNQYVIAGKEPFINNNIRPILKWLGKFKNNHKCISTGIVTNGTLLHNHFDQIADANLSYMDISLDGIPEDHNYIRGNGMFEKTFQNVLWASNYIENLFATMTLNSKNITNINTAIALFNSIGIKNIGISPIENFNHIDNNLNLSENQLKIFFNNLKTLGELHLSPNTFIQIDTGITELQTLLSFVASEWFDIDKIQIDGTGFAYIQYKLKNEATLSFRILLYEMDIDSSVRITSDGHLIAVNDARNPIEYTNNSLANIKNFNYCLKPAIKCATVKYNSTHNYNNETYEKIKTAYSNR